MALCVSGLPRTVMYGVLHARPRRKQVAYVMRGISPRAYFRGQVWILTKTWSLLRCGDLKGTRKVTQDQHIMNQKEKGRAALPRARAKARWEQWERQKIRAHVLTPFGDCRGSPVPEPKRIWSKEFSPVRIVY